MVELQRIYRHSDNKEIKTLYRGKSINILQLCCRQYSNEEEHVLYKSLSTTVRPGKPDLLFRFSHLLDLRAGRSSLFIIQTLCMLSKSTVLQPLKVGMSFQ